MRLSALLFLSALTLSLQLNAQTDVFEASRSGNIKVLKKLCTKNSDTLSALNEHGFSPLILATYRNEIKCVNFLLSKNVDANYISQEGTALHAACYIGNLEIATQLIEHGSDVNLSGGRGASPLIYAVQSKNEELVMLLLEHGADLKVIDESTRTAYDYAIALEMPKLAEKLMP
ncbi:MAG: ankyrin repeat protein [Crocinitomicaceae bacterium]|jgi:ankyrin repeat protein